jgi:very-short-patch-repair endonuclease
MPNPRQHHLNPLLLERARSMRHSPAPAEQKLWDCLRARQLNGFKFRRQHSVGRYIADFYCAECRLVVELDGESHDRSFEHDRARTDWLERNAYAVVRYSNTDVYDNLDDVLLAILKECESRTCGHQFPSPS